MTCAFQSQCYTSFLIQREETFLEKQVPSDIQEHLDADREKGNSLRQKMERSFLGNYSVVCVIISLK